MKQLLFDIKTHKLCRTGDPKTSRQAARKMVKSGKAERQRAMVLKYIYKFLESTQNKDFTAKELSRWSGVNYIIIQRRKHEIDEIEETSIIRDGCKAWRLK
jgi:hypothetical protein